MAGGGGRGLSFDAKFRALHRIFPWYGTSSHLWMLISRYCMENWTNGCCLILHWRDLL